MKIGIPTIAEALAAYNSDPGPHTLERVKAAVAASLGTTPIHEADEATRAIPKQILAHNTKMPSERQKVPASIQALMAEQPPEFTQASREFSNDPDILNALAIPSAPFEVSGRRLGDAALNTTGSPAFATAAYLAGSGMLGAAPLELGAKGLPALGKAGLEAIHNGMAFGEGPLSGLSHLAPSVIKREGGNWFPGEIEKQVKKLQSAAPSKEIQDWIAGPMKNYIQKRFASPNDEIRKLYDQGITISPPPEQQNVAPLQAFVDWAKQAKIDQGHPYIDKDELLSKYKELSGDTDGPVY